MRGLECLSFGSVLKFKEWDHQNDFLASRAHLIDGCYQWKVELAQKVCFWISLKQSSLKDFQVTQEGFQ